MKITITTTHIECDACPSRFDTEEAAMSLGWIKRGRDGHLCSTCKIVSAVEIERRVGVRRSGMEDDCG